MLVLDLVILLVVVGFVLWLVQTLVPMNAAVKRALVGVVLFVLCLYLLRLFVPGLGTMRIGR